MSFLQPLPASSLRCVSVSPSPVTLWWSGWAPPGSCHGWAGVVRPPQQHIRVQHPQAAAGQQQQQQQWQQAWHTPQLSCGVVPPYTTTMAAPCKIVSVVCMVALPHILPLPPNACDRLLPPALPSSVTRATPRMLLCTPCNSASTEPVMCRAAFVRCELRSALPEGFVVSLRAGRRWAGCDGIRLN